MCGPEVVSGERWTGEEEDGGATSCGGKCSAEAAEASGGHDNTELMICRVGAKLRQVKPIQLYEANKSCVGNRYGLLLLFFLVFYWNANLLGVS